MAEFLIKAKRHWSYKSNMTTAEQTEYNKQWQIGDIVQVFPDGRLSDTQHGNGAFFIIRVSGLSFDTAKKYMDEWNDETDMRICVKRRKYNIDYLLLPTLVITELQNNHVYNTSWNAVRGYIRNKITDTTE